MKLAVVAANGKAGKQIVKEAVARGIEVTAIARGTNKTVTPLFMAKDLFDLTAEDLQGFEVVIDAFGTWQPETMPQHVSSLNHLCNCLSQSHTRLIVVGGAGSLYVDPEHTVQLIETPDFPDDFKPLAVSMAKGLEVLRSKDDIQWTYISPAADFQAEGERTGKYRLGGEELQMNAQGESKISYADYAIAVVDEALTGRNIKKRISVVSD